MVDMAHFAGLVAAGLHPNPVPHAHVVTTTTHKTLGGPRGGVILSNDPAIAKKINSSVFPGQQGGPLEHVIAAKAVAFKLAAEPEFARAPAAHPPRRPDHRRPAARRRRRRSGHLRGQRRHRRPSRPGRPARLRPGRAAGRGPPAPDRHHREPQRGALRPAAADGVLGPADRDPGAGHPRLRRRRLRRGRGHHRQPPSNPTSTTQVGTTLRGRVTALAERHPLYPALADSNGAALMAERTAGAPRLPVAQPRAEGLLRRRDRRRRWPRPGHRLLPGQEPRHHQHRRARTRLARRRQHGPEHRDHPVQLPLGRVLGDLRALAEALGGPAGRARVRLLVQPARRDEPRAHAAGRPRLASAGSAPTS